MKHSDRYRRLRCLIFAAAFAVGFGTVGAFAQQPASPPSADAAEPTRAQLEAQIAVLQNYIKAHEAQWNNAASVDPKVLQAYTSEQIKEYEYLVDEMNINIRAYETQRTASNVILWVVVLVVVAGIVFSGFQLWKSVSVGVQSTTDLELSAGKVRVTSSVVGVVVLTMSLVFLYIYTQQIYHIQVVGASPPEAAAKH